MGASGRTQVALCLAATWILWGSTFLAITVRRHCSVVVVMAQTAFSAFAILLRSTRASVAMSYTFVNPVVAAWLGVSLAGETLTPSEMVATAIILGSVILLLLVPGTTPAAR